MKRVLIVEDDKDIAELIEIHLKDLDCDVTIKRDGNEGLNEAINTTFDLIILDIMLPGTDGLEICRKVRANNITTPILMLTAKAEEIDKVVGLEMGADDYLTKPFSIKEFIARVKALFRRAQIGNQPPKEEKIGQMNFEELTINIDKRKVLMKSNRIELTPKEFELLLLLSSNPGKSYSRGQILNLVWGYEFEGYEHTVNSHINRLRMKIEEDAAQPKFILTTWGVGYRFNDDI